MSSKINYLPVTLDLSLLSDDSLANLHRKTWQEMKDRLNNKVASGEYPSPMSYERELYGKNKLSGITEYRRRNPEFSIMESKCVMEYHCEKS